MVFQGATTASFTGIRGSNITVSNSTFTITTGVVGIDIGAGYDNITFSGNTFNINNGLYLFRTITAGGTINFSTNTITGYSSGALFNINQNGTFNIIGNTITINGTTPDVFTATSGTGAVTIQSNNITISTKTSNNVIYFFAGTWTVNIDSNVITNTDVTQAQSIINIKNQTSPVIQNNTIDTSSTGPLRHIVISSTGTAGGTLQIKNNTLRSRSTSDMIVIVGTDAADAGSTKLNGGIIENNTIYAAIYYDPSQVTSDTHAIYYSQNVNAIIRYNTIIGAGMGVVIKGTGEAYSSGGVYYNKIINSNAVASIRIKGVKNVPVYNNSVYSNSTLTSRLVYITEYNAGETATGTILKNNILYCGNCNAVEINDGSQTNFVSDYNNIFRDTGTIIGVMGATTYSNFSSWQTAGFDTHGVNANPLYTNAGSYNFILQPGSPAINIGTDLGFIRDFVNTSVPQGTLPDAGAYEFLLPSSPSSLAQYKSDGTTTISSGAFTGESTVTLKFSMSSTNTSDSLTPQLEVRENGTAFTNAVTNSGSAVTYSGSAVTGTVTVTGLTSGTTYHWQARINNSAGAGSWVSMGGNPDFQVDTSAPSIPGAPSTTTPTAITKPVWTWTASTDSGGSGLANPAYTLQWSTDSSFGSGVNTTTVNTNSFTHSTALTDGTWYFRVKATDAVNNSSSYSTSGTVVIDTAGPTSGSLSSPTGYSTNTKPTLVFKKASDAGSSLSSYSVSLDDGKNKNYSTSGIPTSGNGTSNYVWKDDSTVKVTFVNENDSDSGNDEIQVYFKGLDTTELSEGKHTWTVTAYDNASNSTSKSADFYIDKTSPSISELAIANVSTVLSGVSYNLNITNRMPSFSGLAFDSYQGSTVTNSNGTKDTFDKVSSGPQTITLTFKKQKSDKTYTDYSTKDFSLSDIQDTNGDKKSTRFYVTTPFPLVDGYYQVTLVLKDSAGNSYSQPVFYIALNSSGINPVQKIFTNSLDTKVTEQNTVPATTTEEKQQVKENGYIVKVKVVDTQNKPAAGAKVTIHSKVQETTTDKNGIALFNSVEPGQHKILIAYSGYSVEQSVNLTGDVKEFDFNIQVKQTNAFLNPQVILVIGIMAFIILITVVLLIKAKRKA